MKIEIVFFLVLMSQNWLIAQFYFEIGDTLTVIAKSGVNLRELPATSSLVQEKVPFNSKIVAAGSYEKYDEFEDRQGYWLKVKYHDQLGYLFSGFISKVKIPKSHNLEGEDPLVWFENFIRHNVDSLACKGEVGRRGFDLERSVSLSRWEIYKNETEIIRYYGYEIQRLIIESHEINMNDWLNIMEYFIDFQYKTQENPSLENRIPKLKISKDKQGNLKKIECSYLESNSDIIVEKSLNKTILIVDDYP